MGIETHITDGNMDFLLGASAYAAASASDYLLTAAGLLSKQLSEGNPVLNPYIDFYGAEGIALEKMLIGTGIIFLCASLDYLNNQGKSHLRGDYILFAGAVATTIPTLLWTIFK